MEQAIIEMCKKLTCVINPTECIYAIDRYQLGYDCNGPFTKEDFIAAVNTTPID